MTPAPLPCRLDSRTCIRCPTPLSKAWQIVFGCRAAHQPDAVRLGLPVKQGAKRALRLALHLGSNGGCGNQGTISVCSWSPVAHCHLHMILHQCTSLNHSTTCTHHHPSSHLQHRLHDLAGAGAVHARLPLRLRLLQLGVHRVNRVLAARGWGATGAVGSGEWGEDGAALRHVHLSSKAYHARPHAES